MGLALTAEMDTLSQKFSGLWRDTKSVFKTKHIEKSQPGPAFIAEWDYQVESSSSLGSFSHPPPSPALSFEQLSKDSDHGTRDKRFGIAPTTFTCFGKLPMELRILIWGMACEQRRNVSIELNPSYKQGDLAPDQRRNGYICTSNTPHPSVFYACKASREEAFKHYSLLFREKLFSPRFSIEIQPRIWCNLKADTLCLKSFGWNDRVYEDFFKNLPAKDMISSLAFNIQPLINCNSGRFVPAEVDWYNMFRIVNAYGARGLELREIILYYDVEENRTHQPVVSEFVELDWSVMDSNSRKTKELQRVQGDLLRDLSSWPVHRELLLDSRAIYLREIQSRFKLMDLKVSY
ncbi:e52af8c4-b0a7-4ea3-8be9-257d2d09ee86 [Sclerotinia trifoliorum]|uniref:E52af8c4-b0a7-4ea3-8be9-257d2d09ee86 n=1 Tax=Sclerotinia trifoliorum TaxID=28548 RepID=A0A8H2VPX5_9HELO|nr:e52af8c4-b0a7-4ea3-8be9-257d2d09ee86 [Sclerotinia trifoliorum]